MIATHFVEYVSFTLKCVCNNQDSGYRPFELLNPRLLHQNSLAVPSDKQSKRNIKLKPGKVNTATDVQGTQYEKVVL